MLYELSRQRLYVKSSFNQCLCGNTTKNFSIPAAELNTTNQFYEINTKMNPLQNQLFNELPWTHIMKQYSETTPRTSTAAKLHEPGLRSSKTNQLHLSIDAVGAWDQLGPQTYLIRVEISPSNDAKKKKKHRKHIVY